MTDEPDKAKDSNWYWPKTDDPVSALEAARAGSIGGGIMLAGLLLATALVYFSGDYDLFHADDLQAFYINQSVQIVLVVFLTWRVYTGRGRFSSVLLLIWVLVEVAVKLLVGQLNMGWGIMWLFAIMALIHSIRGSWALRRHRKVTVNVA